MSNESKLGQGAELQAIHGLVLVLSFLPLAVLPTQWIVWPVPFALPLSLYAVILSIFPSLRQTALWCRLGRSSPRLLASSIGLALVSCGCLIAFHLLSRPDTSHLDACLPIDLVGHFAATTVVFALLNAVMEESVFRGILFQAFTAEWNWPVAAVITSILFGMGHYGGYPPGLLGGVLAGLYGLSLAILRQYSGGLLLPVAVHVTLDTTIMLIRVLPTFE